MSTLSISTSVSGDVSFVTVSGRVDSETAPQLDDALAKFTNGEGGKIVVNLRGVDYMSSAGLRALVKAYQAARKSGGDLRLAAVSNPVEVVLRTVGMMDMLKSYPTDKEAASF
jgi:anti-sigma B factor antagonist